MAIKNIGKRNRQAGHQYERNLAEEFRNLGYHKCLTSRQASRLLDDCKVDLYGIPFNIQAKNVRSSLNYHLIFTEISEKLEEKLPERLDLITAIFHKKKGKEFVILKKEAFYCLIRNKGVQNEVHKEIL